MGKALFSQAVGKEEGSAFKELSCPSGSVAAGAELRGGNSLDAFGMLCAKLKTAEADPKNPIYKMLAGNTRGGLQYTDPCPEKQVMIGIAACSTGSVNGANTVCGHLDLGTFFGRRVSKATPSRGIASKWVAIPSRRLSMLQGKALSS